jgi:phosphoesterase RecJ-like protein
MTDTGSFRFPSATTSVFTLVAHLKNIGINHSKIHGNIYDNFTENRVRFLGYCLLKKMEVLYEYNTALLHITKGELYKFHIKTGDTEGLVNYLLSIQGIQFGALVIDRDEERKWSFRSKNNFDVNTFARLHFNGGGHYNAAGGKSNDNLNDTITHFLNVLPQYQQQLNT